MNPEFNEGLGTVYEKLMLNRLLEKFIDEYGIKSVLEAPLWGMSGVPGLNSYIFAKRGLPVTLFDDDEARVARTGRLWDSVALKPQITLVKDFSAMPAANGSFDFVWNFAALWHHRNAAQIINEMVRVSQRYVFISVVNRLQIGYFMRKVWLEKDFFNHVDERWVRMKEVKKVLRENGARVIKEGVTDVPPFPDTCMPIAEVLKKMGFKGQGAKDGEKNSWYWTTMEHYQGRDPSLPRKIDRYSFLERLPLPWWLKIIWAHHHYVLAEKI